MLLMVAPQKGLCLQGGGGCSSPVHGSIDFEARLAEKEERARHQWFYVKQCMACTCKKPVGE